MSKLASRIALAAALALPACKIHRLEAVFEEHGLTFDSSTGGPDSESSAGDSSDTGDGEAASTTGGDAGQDASGESGTTTTTTTGATTTASDTGEPMTGPVCGNGVLEPFGLVPEECDDGNLLPEDGCGDTCAADRIIFVSSKLYKAGDLMSLYLADAVCAQMAEDAGLPNWGKFRAWLSDSKTHARDRFKFSRGRLVMVNGLPVADSWIDLLAGKLQRPIEVTEKSETYHGSVWTGTDPQGVAVAGSTHCDDWSSLSGNKTAYYGQSDRMDAEWTLSTSFDNPFPCIGNLAVYCLEVH